MILTYRFYLYNILLHFFLSRPFLITMPLFKMPLLVSLCA